MAKIVAAAEPFERFAAARVGGASDSARTSIKA